MTTTIDSQDPLAVTVTRAIRQGDVPALRRLLAENPGLASAKIAETAHPDCSGIRTLLHIATDWPGHFPNGPQVLAALVEAGADPHARFSGAHTETPLHWAASNDDVAAVDALVAAGADIEAPGAVIGDGTPLADACAFGQWRAASRLVEHGARVTFEQAASLGLLDRVRAHAAAEAPPTPEEVSSAFWCACHGGRLATARYLYELGADPHRVGYGDRTPLDIAREQGATDVVEWLSAVVTKPRGDSA
ncbi:ankyrin repeat domain-containing protein [Streptomyces sp. NPDC001939]|uniref:ankyrin repeat domain-containing protein n=1 Tax=Streptomyces TaxID=1883 RepID=UPI001D0A9CDA|nr:ankyrin repeat domain-containing protein [Streptomyces longhuiensis]UDM03913.1 ankyrin repeat domain-containing protein [Streptomyces longhuiensis]